MLTEDTTQGISEYEDEEKLKVSLSFKQISHFNFNPNELINIFNIFGLTTQPIPEGYWLILELYLKIGVKEG